MFPLRERARKGSCGATNTTVVFLPDILVTIVNVTSGLYYSVYCPLAYINMTCSSAVYIGVVIVNKNIPVYTRRVYG